MKNLLIGILLFAFLISFSACEKESFNPQTPKDAFEQMLEIFETQTEYRRVCQSQPEESNRGVVTDLSFQEIGTENQKIFGEVRSKNRNSYTVVYAEGNLAAEKTQTDTVSYLQKENAVIDLHECLAPAIQIGVEDSDRAKNLFSPMMLELIGEDSTLEKKEDGSFTLTVPLTKDQTPQLYNIDSHTAPYRYDSRVVYTLDAQGRVTRVEHFQSNTERKTLSIEYYYGPISLQKPEWFNKEEPLNSDIYSVKMTYEMESSCYFTLSEKGGKKTIYVDARNEDCSVETVPAFLPTDATYEIDTLDHLIFENYSEDMDLPNHPYGTKFYFKKGTRPQDNTNKKTFFFEGEWKEVNGVPVPNK